MRLYCCEKQMFASCTSTTQAHMFDRRRSALEQTHLVAFMTKVSIVLHEMNETDQPCQSLVASSVPLCDCSCKRGNGPHSVRAMKAVQNHLCAETGQLDAIFVVQERVWTKLSGAEGQKHKVNERLVKRAWCVRLLRRCSGCGSSLEMRTLHNSPVCWRSRVGSLRTPQKSSNHSHLRALPQQS